MSIATDTLAAIARSPRTAADARRAAEVGDQAAARIDGAVTKAGVLLLVLAAVWLLR